MSKTLITLFLGFLLFSCSKNSDNSINPIQHEEIVNTPGQIYFSMSTAQLAAQSGSTIDSITVELQGPTTLKSKLSFSEDSTIASGKFSNLKQGDYTIYIIAFSGTNEIATGFGNATIVPGKQTTVNITLTYTGVLIINVTLPSISFSSNDSWDAIDSIGQIIGKAQYVALNENYPPSCPSGAKIYNYPSSGWSAVLSKIPNSFWIWGPDSIMNSTGAAYSKFTFRKTINLPVKPTYAEFYIAVDDSALVEINGSTVIATGSITVVEEAYSAQSSLKRVEIHSFLHKGNNEIIVRAQNGPNSFSSFQGPDSWQNNPAGVVFGGIIY